MEDTRSEMNRLDELAAGLHLARANTPEEADALLRYAKGESMEDNIVFATAMVMVAGLLMRMVRGAPFQTFRPDAGSDAERLAKSLELHDLVQPEPRGGEGWVLTDRGHEAAKTLFSMRDHSVAVQYMRNLLEHEPA